MAPKSRIERTSSRINAIVPLALLQTIRTIDRTDPVDLEEFADEIGPRRLGTSPTVAAQIDRYERLVKRGAYVGEDDAVQLFQLVGRRNDAELVFSQAGRVAAQHALSRISRASRLVHRGGLMFARRKVGLRRASRLARRVLGATMAVDEDGGITAAAQQPILDTGSAGATCELWGGAMAELLRRCTAFDGALVHRQCRARGDASCSWDTGPNVAW